MPIPPFLAELRAMIGGHPLWLPGVTAVIRRPSAGGGEEILLVRRSDSGRWNPVTGIVDPGEAPAACAVREAMEETGVEIRVDRLAGVFVVPETTYPNGDRAAYVDHTVSCTWLAGDAHVADDESTDVRWCPAAALPELSPSMTERVQAALSDEIAARV